VQFYRSEARVSKAFHDNRRMFARLSAFVIWSLVAATAVFWALRLAASPAPVPPYAVAVSKSVVVRGDLTRLFGVPPRLAVVAGAAPEAPSRFKLLGVMAPRSPAAQAEEGRGVALIAVDGKPAKAYAIGARLDGDLVLQSVGLRTAAIGTAQGARSVLLELPALPAPHSGVLPPLAGSGGSVPPPAVAPRPPLPSGAPPLPSAPPPNMIDQAPPIVQPPPGGLAVPSEAPQLPMPSGNNAR
jgi:general secretion pathway protein C